MKSLGIYPMGKQFIFCFWQIKKDTLAGSFGFVGRKMAFTIGKSTTLIKPFLYLQKQCKHYRFSHTVAKNSYRKSSLKQAQP
jgi:hypothetical protein